VRNCLAVFHCSASFPVIISYAPRNLKVYCTPVSALPGRCSLWSSSICHLVAPRMRTSTAHSRSFASVGTDCLGPLGLTSFHYSSYQFRKRLKASLFVSENTGLGRKCLWIFKVTLYKFSITLITITSFTITHALFTRTSESHKPSAISHVHSSMHSFITRIYIAPLRRNYSEALPTPARPNKTILRWEMNAWDRVLGRERSARGRPF